jgi:GDP-D-mannose dehydratase
MLLIISKERPIDICICTSEGNSVKNLVKSICNCYELNCDDLVRIDNSLSRQYEPKSIIGDNKILKDHLKIESPLKMNETIKKIINNRKKIKEDERKLDRVSDFLNKEKINTLKKSFSL